MGKISRPRNLGLGLGHALCSKSQSIDTDFWRQCTSHLKVYAVLRTKGGSGERHTVRVIQQQLIMLDERPIIVRVFGTRQNEYGQHFGSLALLESTDTVSGSITWNWGGASSNRQLAGALSKSSFTSVILTQGGSSGVSYEDVMKAAELARHTYLSVNVDCDVSRELHENIVEELEKSMLSLECVSSVLWKGNRWDEPSYELANLSNVSIEDPLL